MGHNSEVAGQEHGALRCGGIARGARRQSGTSECRPVDRYSRFYGTSVTPTDVFLIASVSPPTEGTTMAALRATELS